VPFEVDPHWYDGFFDDDWLTLLELRATPARVRSP
jgi:hypothetical protein